MKNFLLFSITLIFCIICHAQSNWISVAVTSDLNYQHFLDMNSTQKQGDSITFWYRTNYKVRNKYGILSSKVQKTINCRTQEEISRYFMFYDDINNEGKLMDDSPAKNASWKPIPPDSAVSIFYNTLCK